MTDPIESEPYETPHGSYGVPVGTQLPPTQRGVTDYVYLDRIEPFRASRFQHEPPCSSDSYRRIGERLESRTLSGNDSHGRAMRDAKPARAMISGTYGTVTPIRDLPEGRDRCGSGATLQDALGFRLPARWNGSTVSPPRLDHRNFSVA